MIDVYVNNRGIVLEAFTLTPSWSFSQKQFSFSFSFFKRSRVLDKVVSFDHFSNGQYRRLCTIYIIWLEMLPRCLSGGSDCPICNDVINANFGPFPWQMKINILRNAPWRKKKRIHQKHVTIWVRFEAHNAVFVEEGGNGVIDYVITLMAIPDPGASG